MNYKKLIEFLEREMKATEQLKKMIGEILYIDERSEKICNEKIENCKELLSMIQSLQHSEDRGNAGERP